MELTADCLSELIKGGRQEGLRQRALGLPFDALHRLDPAALN